MMYRGQPIVGFADVSACPSNPPAPSGYAIWKGTVPKVLSDWAKLLLKKINKMPLGSLNLSDPDVYPQPILARVDSHTWTYRGGRLVTGICIKGITLYRPMEKGLVGGPEFVFDPATAAPDPTLALYDPAAVVAQRRTDWGLVAATGAALGATVVLFAWGLHAAGRAA